MSHYILTSEIIFLAGASFRIVYLNWRQSRADKLPKNFQEWGAQSLLNLQSLYGYNEHSLVGISARRKTWLDDESNSGVSYTEHGRVWLVAGEMLASDENLLASTQRFLQAARDRKKIVAFLPTTEKFARVITSATELRAVKIGAAPCFDLQSWNPRGNKAKHMRAGLNQARRKNISVEEVADIGTGFQAEADGLCRKWLKTRRSIIKFGWLFELKPFRNAERKKYFTARDEAGALIGLLVSSPVSAREGWYLEDILRAPDSPNGTADLLVFEAMKSLAAEGAKFATLGTVPLAKDAGGETLESEGNSISKKAMKLSRKYLNAIYNFEGLRQFKAKFVPTWWESQYILIPKGLFVPLLILEAFLYTLFQDR